MANDFLVQMDPSTSQAKMISIKGKANLQKKKKHKPKFQQQALNEEDEDYSEPVA